MKEQLIRVLELQKTDDTLRATLKILEESPGEISSLDEQLEKFTQMLNTEKQQLEETIQWQKAQEERLKEEEQRIVKSKQQMQQVRNTKEFTATQRQLDTSRKAMQEQEEEILRMMEAVEGYKTTIEQHSREYDELKHHIEMEKKIIQEKLEQAESHKAQVMERRRQITEKIEPSVLATYERIGTRRHPVIVSVDDTTCGGCKMRVQPQLFNELYRADSLKSCPYCQRLLYLTAALFPEKKETPSTPDPDPSVGEKKS